MLVDWANYCATNESYDESISILNKILRIELSKQALEKGVEINSSEVNSFYESKAIPQPEDEGEIMVVQSDGKGVPMIQEEVESKSIRLSKGEKRGKKKEAVVTAIYTIEPYKRTPEDILSALLLNENANIKTINTKRPVPAGKEVRATMDGKDVAFEYITDKVEKRDGKHIKYRVALTDGAPSLQDKVHDYLPSFTLVLDIIHASEYIWDAANAYLGEKNPGRIKWVGSQLLKILSGETKDVIKTLENIVENESLSKVREKIIGKTIGYYKRNLPYMRYNKYLKKGWPIGTGVIEGACGHLVKDRMECAGMKWKKEGAQSILDLRAVRLNKDWNKYQLYYQNSQHNKLYRNNLGVLGMCKNTKFEQAA